MQRSGLAVVLLAAIPTVAVLATGQQSVFRSTTDAVTVHVSVRHGKRPVQGLTAADFVLTDQDKIQTGLGSSTDRQPLDVTLVLDVSGSMNRAFGYAQVGAKWIAGVVPSVTRLLGPDDRLQLWRLDAQAREVPLTAKSVTIEASSRTGTVLLDALTDALMLTNSPGRQRMILVLTDGRDWGSVIPGPLRDVVFDRSDAVLEIVTVRSFSSGVVNRPTSTIPLGCNTMIAPHGWAAIAMVGTCGKSDWLLNDLTARTGGQVYYSEAADDVSPQVAAAIDEWKSGYLLSYVPTDVPAVGWHAVAVQVKGHKDYAVTARRGYWRD